MGDLNLKRYSNQYRHIDEPPPPKSEKSSLSRHNSSIPPILASSVPPDTREDVYAARSAMNSDPLLVMDDFSAARQPPNQTTIHAFWSAADPWIKSMGLEDLANLELEVGLCFFPSYDAVIKSGLIRAMISNHLSLFLLGATIWIVGTMKIPRPLPKN